MRDFILTFVVAAALGIAFGHRAGINEQAQKDAAAIKAAQENEEQATGLEEECIQTIQAKHASLSGVPVLPAPSR